MDENTLLAIIYRLLKKDYIILTSDGVEPTNDDPYMVSICNKINQLLNS